MSSDIVRDCSLASSKKEHFQEDKEGHPLSKIKLFRCFHYVLGSNDEDLHEEGILVLLF